MPFLLGVIPVGDSTRVASVTLRRGGVLSANASSGFGVDGSAAVLVMVGGSSVREDVEPGRLLMVVRRSAQEERH